jgi:hypothetical protein
MRHFILIAALLLATLPAFADSIAIDGRLVTTGDGAGKVIDVAGKPDRVVQLETKYGGAVGERWEYYRDGKTLMIEFQAGKVASITETR